MIAVIRISGQVGLNKDVISTLERLRLKRKYSCVVFVKPKKEELGMIKKVRNFVAYGNISDEVFQKLLETRGKLTDKSKKLDSKKVAEELKKGKSYQEVGLKPFFRLHPPRKGIESKKHFGVGKGVLGENKQEINKLIERML